MQPSATPCNLVQQDSRMRKTNPIAPKCTKMHRMSRDVRKCHDMRAKAQNEPNSPDLHVSPVRAFANGGFACNMPGQRKESEHMKLAHRIGCSLALLSLCIALGGCAGGGGGKGRSPARAVTKAPPPVPPLVNVPVQPALQQQARTEMHRAAQQSTSPLVRAHALELMREAAPEEAPPYVIKGLDDQAAVVRFAAALAAGELKIDARDRLRQIALEDPDSSVQIAARFALHRLGDTRLSRELEKTARSENPRTRGDTAMVLGLLGEKSGLNILRALRNDRDPAVRLQVAEAMWRLGDDQALEPLVAGTLSHYPDDQMMAGTGQI